MPLPQAVSQSNISVRLAELLASLSLAMDLGTGQPMEWVMKCCLLGARLAETIGLSERDRREVYYLSLLRHIGCTAVSSMSADLLGGDLLMSGLSPVDVDPHNPAQLMNSFLQTAGKGQPPLQRARTMANALVTAPRIANEVRATQCEIAGQMAGTFGLDPQTQRDLWQLFERWDGRGYPGGLKGEALALPVRVIQLAHDATSFQMAAGAEAAIKVIRERSGGLYDPGLADVFCRAATDLFSCFENASLWEALLAAEPGGPVYLSDDQLDNALQAVADFADMKSAYTLGHSRSVAELAAGAARAFGLPEADAVRLRQAGYVHDLGRISVSTMIWNRPGPLTEGEWERVRLHPYYTERILARSAVLQPIGALAASHHERLDGSGYHHHLTTTALSVPARILATADAYSAMTEARPHRPALTPEATAEELWRATKSGVFDTDVVNAVLNAAGHLIQPRRRAKSATELSQREIEVLRLVARGLSNRQIAGQLSISVKTVGHHVQHIYDKISVSTRAGAALFAMQNHLLG